MGEGLYVGVFCLAVWLARGVFRRYSSRTMSRAAGAAVLLAGWLVLSVLAVYSVAYIAGCGFRAAT